MTRVKFVNIPQPAGTVPPENENWEPNPDFKAPTKIELASDGLVVISIRTMDLYFKAKGEFSEEHKIIFEAAIKRKTKEASETLEIHILKGLEHTLKIFKT